MAGGIWLATFFATPITAQTVHDAAGFMLSSPSFRDGDYLALKNAGNNKANPNCLGDNVLPPLQWSNAPENTRSFALIMVDLQGRRAGDRPLGCLRHSCIR